MRVTSSMMVRNAVHDLGVGYKRLAATQTQLVTGRSINRPSDHPTNATDAMGFRQQLRRNDQFLRNIDDATGWLNTVDSRLMTGHDRLVRGKEIVVLGMNSGAHASPEARVAMAAEIRGIRDEMLEIANGRYGDRPIFAGTAAAPAYDADGTYLGDDRTVRRAIGPNAEVTVNATGPQVFGESGFGAGSLFEVLERIAVAIENGDTTTLNDEHGNLDEAMARISSVAVEIGARASRLESVQIRALDDELNLKTMLSQVEDVDMVDALVAMQAQQNSYEAALSTTAKILPMSLLNFLR